MLAGGTLVDADGDVQQDRVIERQVNGRPARRTEAWRRLLTAITGRDR